MNENLMAQIEQLDTETREKVIEMARNVTINPNSIGLRLSHIAELIRNKALSSNM